MNSIISSDQTKLAEAIEGLFRVPTVELKRRWGPLCGSEAPPRISRDLLIRALAYRLQERVLGGLKPGTRRLLAKVAARKPLSALPVPELKPGTVLLRSWHGTEHRVIVRDRSIEFEGRQYRSLSQVAWRITGSKWSGPRFFGLKQQRREQSFND